MSTSYNSKPIREESLGQQNFQSDKTRAIRRLHNGVSIVGCDPGCGKTVLMAGLTGVLADQGNRIRAVKPITYARQNKSSPEYSFISCITKSSIDYPCVHLSFPPTLPQTSWDQIIQSATSGDAFTFVEIPTGVATPLSFERDGYNRLTHEWWTTTDLIRALTYPVILVANHAPEALEKLSLSLNYLQSGGIEVIALATVETNVVQAQMMDRYISKDDFELFLITSTGVPYLGCLKYSSSINVEQVSQGNVKRTTEECLDLLVLRRSLNLPV